MLVPALASVIVILLLVAIYMASSWPDVDAIKQQTTADALIGFTEQQAAIAFAEKYKGVDHGNYTFYPGWTSGSGTIKMGSTKADTNKAKCDSMSNCKAFTTSGWGIQNPSSDKTQWKPFYQCENTKVSLLRSNQKIIIFYFLIA
tara:strand:- start:305 stop:739 length:435 start_codon:yes stop_codon:yes gene_type:complete